MPRATNAKSPEARSRTRFVAPQTKAMVVFVRDGRFGVSNAELSFVLDEDERLVAGLKGGTYSTLVLDPGHHAVFVFSGPSGRWVELDVSPGRTYFIGLSFQNDVRPQLEITLLRHGETTLEDAREWLGDADRYGGGRAKLSRRLKQHRRAMKLALEEGNEERARGVAGYANRLVLRPEDGFARKDAIALGAAE